MPTRLTAIFVLAFAACADRPEPLDVSPADYVQPAPDPIAQLGIHLARAMSDPLLRQQILKDLRDSPFPGHRIHFQSYLAGKAGALLLERMVSVSGQSRTDLFSSLARAQPLELAVSASLDRVSWTGTDDIVVVATSLSKDDLFLGPYVRGFDVKGEPHDVSLFGRYSRPVLSLMQASFDFGNNPERARLSVPPRSRSTISTFEAEFTDCDPETAIIPCDPPDDPTALRPGPSTHVGSDCSNLTYTTSDPSADLDSDGIKDSCELAFAEAFQPRLIFNTIEAYAAREPYWTVQRIGNPPWLTIMYLLSYYYDGPPYAHHGDSEWIRVVLAPSNNTDSWAIVYATLSAHWGVCCWGDETRTFNGQQLSYVLGRPSVYVSNNHHANYESEARCDDRVGDECSANYGYNTSLVSVVAGANLGSRWSRFDLDAGLAGQNDCTRSRISPGYDPHSGWECFFSTSSLGLFRV